MVDVGEVDVDADEEGVDELHPPLQAHGSHQIGLLVVEVERT